MAELSEILLLIACCEQASSFTMPCISTSIPRSTCGSKPGASLGGVILDASGTMSVSSTTPVPTEGLFNWGARYIAWSDYKR